MSAFVDFLFERIPYLEVFCRRVFYFFKSDKKVNKNIKKKKKKPIKVCLKAKDYFLQTIKSLGIKKGDTLIVHSGYSELKVTGLTIEEIISFLFEILGESGTLVMPAYPDYSNQDKEPFIYDVTNSKSWTGAIPNYFCFSLGAKRSMFPNNPLACMGAKADAILKLNQESVYPHGVNSAWYNCVCEHAKILFIGTNIAHSNTVVHVAEDLLGDEFPIENWYEKVSYQVIYDNKTIPVVVNQRRQFWSRYIDENRNTRRLKKKGLALETIKYGIHIGFIKDSNDVMSEILNRAKNKKLEYKIPKKYWK